MERTIITLSAITEEERDLLATKGVNSGTYILMLGHVAIITMLPVASVVFIQKLWRIRQFISTGQDIESGTTMGDVTTYFTQKPDPQVLPIPPIPPHGSATFSDT